MLKATQRPIGLEACPADRASERDSLMCFVRCYRGKPHPPKCGSSGVGSPDFTHLQVLVLENFDE